MAKMTLFTARKDKPRSDCYIVKCGCPSKNCIFKKCKTYLYGKRQALDLRNFLNTKWAEHYNIEDVENCFDDLIVDLDNNPITI